MPKSTSEAGSGTADGTAADGTAEADGIPAMLPTSSPGVIRGKHEGAGHRWFTTPVPVKKPVPVTMRHAAAVAAHGSIIDKAALCRSDESEGFACLRCREELDRSSSELSFAPVNRGAPGAKTDRRQRKKLAGTPMAPATTVPPGER